MLTREGVEIRDARRAPRASAPVVRSRARRRCWSTRAITAISWRRRSTSSRKSSATRSRIISTWSNERVRAAGEAAVRLARTRAPVDLGLRHRLLCRAGRANTGSSASRALPVEIDVASEFRYRERAAASRAGSRSSSRNRARPPTRWRRCATPRSTSSTSSRSSTCRPRPSRARATW